MVLSVRIHQWFSVVALLVSALSFPGTDANEWCTCLASFYEFKLDFAKTCEDRSIPLLNGAINAVFCQTFEGDEFAGELSYKVPVKLTNLTIVEFGIENDQYTNNVIDIDTENLIDGSTFTHQIEDPTNYGLQIVLVGEDEFGEKITNTNTIFFDFLPYACPVDLAIQKEQRIGWIEVVDHGSFPDICVSAAPSGAPSESQNPSASTVPSEIPSSTPTDLPTDEPSLVPSSDPSEWDPCANVPSFRSEGKVGRDCTWVAEKPEKRCHLDYNALDNCPSVCSSSCNNNKVCGDDPTFRANDDDEKDCDWIAKKPQTRCIKDENALHKCPSVCSPVCTGNCEISDNYKYKGKKTEDM